MRDVSVERPKANHNVGFERDEHGHADIYAQFATEPEPKDAYELMHKGHHALNDAAFDWKPCATLVMYRRRRGKCGPGRQSAGPKRIVF